MSAELQHRDEFEKMLQSEAESFRLEPSENVWRKVKRVLHPRSRGRIMPWLWLPLLLIITGAGGYLAFHGLMRKHPVPAKLAKTVNSAEIPVTPVTVRPAPVTVRPAPVIARPAPAIARARPVVTGTAVNRNVSPPAMAVSAFRNNINRPVSGRPKSLPAPEKVQEPAGSVPSPATAGAVQSKNSGTPAGAVRNKNTGAPAGTDSVNAGTGSVKTGTDSVKNERAAGAPLPHLMATDSLATAAAVKNTAPLSGRKHGLRWEAGYAPALDYRFLHLPSGSGLDPRMLNQAPVFGFSAGIRAIRHLKGKWSLATGLEINEMGYTIDARKTYAANVNGNRAASFVQPNSFFYVTGAANSTLFAAAQSQGNLSNSYLYTGIPLLAGYRLQFHNHWSLDLTAGAGIDYLAAKKINILSPAGRYFTDDSQVRRWNSLLRINPSIGIPLGGKFSLHAGPDFHYQLFSSFKQNEVREHPYSAGFRVSIGIK